MFSLIKANSHLHQTITHRVSAGARVSAGGVDGGVDGGGGGGSECIHGH